jgi:hypothetical protein
VLADEIEWIAAAEDYAELHGSGRSHLIRETMNSLEEKLDPAPYLSCKKGLHGELRPMDCLVNASILSEVVRQLRLDKSNGFNSGTLSIEPFGGSRCRGVLATTYYAFSMVFLGRRKSGKHRLQRNESPKSLV